MNLLDLFSLQGTLFALMIVGAILKKKEIIDANGKKCMTDLCINVVIPCNIFKSCLIEFNMDVSARSSRLSSYPPSHPPQNKLSPPTT